MLDLKAHRKDKTVAFCAALVLLLQTFLASWSFAATHGVTLDAYGNPICITSTDDGSGSADGPVKTQNCCTLGCGMASTVLDEPSAETTIIDQDIEAGAVIGVDRPQLPRVRSDHAPGSPRAPPRTA